jgi:dihydrofolate reductase
MTADAGDRAQGGNVVVQAAMSLDGFIAAPGHSMDWIFEFTMPAETPEMFQATGAMLSGRTTYEVGERDTGKPSGEAYGGAWRGPQFVLTHEPPAGPRPGVTFLSGDIAAAVATGRQAAGQKDLIVLGADVVRQCLERGLVDEVQLTVLPVLLGDGIRLFGSRGSRVDLEPVDAASAGRARFLRYRVAPQREEGKCAG